MTLHDILRETYVLAKQNKDVQAMVRVAELMVANGINSLAMPQRGH